MKTLLVALSVVVLCNALPPALQEWTSFKAKHGKSYHDQNEDYFRLGVYLSNKQMIEEHNAKYQAGLVSYKLKMNHYSDMLQSEVSAMLNGYNSSGLLTRRPGLTFTKQNLMLPSAVDWRQKGAVTPVKNQGQCGACWAFSATGSLEGQMFKKTGRLVSLSEQNLIDCSSEYGNQGCNGGLMSYAIEYVSDNSGLDSEQSYPFEGAERSCRFRSSQVAATAQSYAQVPEGDEEALMEAVATVGPISVAMNAGLSSFTYYAGGVYDDVSCGQTLNHGVLIVGYGTENGQDYWLVKNSWTANWGDEGYVKIARNQGNLCGIASLAGYPVIF